MARPVGAPEVAAAFGRPRGAVDGWRRKDRIGTTRFPDPRWEKVGGGPAWDWDLDIAPWAAWFGIEVKHEPHVVDRGPWTPPCA